MAAMGTKRQLGQDYLLSEEVDEADNRVAIVEARAHLSLAFNSAAPSEVAEEAPENRLDTESLVTAWLDSVRHVESKWL